MTSVLTLKNPETIGFDLFEPWPYEDNSLENVLIENFIMATLPLGNVYGDEVDPLVHVMREAYRVLKEGCTLEINAPHPGGFLGMGHPLQTRIYTEATWYAFGCPENHTISETTIGAETGTVSDKLKEVPLDPRKYQWGAWFGVELGTRLQVMSLEHENGSWTVFYRKIPAKELADE